MKKNHTSQIIGAGIILLAGIISGCRQPAAPAADTTSKDESTLQAGKNLPPWQAFMVPGLESIAFQALAKNTNQIGGVNYGVEDYTNGTGGTGSTIITPSNGVTSFTFSDISGIPAPYNSWAIGIDRVTLKSYPTNSSLYTNTVTFPVTSSHTYYLTVYVKNPPPPPTNGQILTLKLSQN